MNYTEKAKSLSVKDVANLLAERDRLIDSVASFKSQLAWLNQQFFGRKSEKQIEDNPHQLDLFFEEKQRAIEAAKANQKDEESVSIPAHNRKKKNLKDAVDDSGLRFDSSVPVKEIHIFPAELKSHPDEYEIIGEKTVCRIAQRPASYVVLKYIMTVVKSKQTQKIKYSPAPTNIIEKSYADVSFLAGLLVDKFECHLPLYRQHQRLTRAGILLSRSTLSNSVFKAAVLLKPIYHALLKSVLMSRILAIDETPIKAGRKKKGTMKTGYFWPMYGDQDEIVFHFASSRATQVIHTLLEGFQGVLLTDGYTAYEKYAKKHRGDVVHAQCWAHSRRCFIKSGKMAPDEMKQALAYIGGLYQIEKDLRENACDHATIRLRRKNESLAIVNQFFTWVREQRHREDLINSNPLSKALKYVSKREQSLREFIENPEIQIDTNHLERGLRPIPMGKKAWLFCWTEVGAEHVGIIQSLIETCKLHDVHPYEYLVDVLQRISSHPASQVDDLTPRHWKKLFSDSPLKSDLEKDF